MKKDCPNYYQPYGVIKKIDDKVWLQAFENIRFQKPVKKGIFKVVLDIIKKSIQMKNEL